MCGSKRSRLCHRTAQELPNGTASGIYIFQLPNQASAVPQVCDMNTAGGGWTTFQRRGNVTPHPDFEQDWAHYKTGFGSLIGEFWWGLENLFLFTQNRTCEVRIDLVDIDGTETYAVYQEFRILSESTNYTLKLDAIFGFSGNAGRGFDRHVNLPFSTKDNDNDMSAKINCAKTSKGAWWYAACGGNLNGRYEDTGISPTGVWWYQWRGAGIVPLAEAEMKVRCSPAEQ